VSDGINVQDDDKVEFEIEDGDRGKKAVNISITD
jgi:cold shock CspA family protein